MTEETKNIKDHCMCGIEDGTRCSPMKASVPSLTDEKINQCNKNGKCGASCMEEQMGCGFYLPMETLYVGNCLSLVSRGNCVHPDALIAKWEELQSKELRTSNAIRDDWRSSTCKQI